MNTQSIIPINLFKKTLEAIGWIKESSTIEESSVFHYNQNPNIKAYIPKASDRPDYLFHQNRNLEFVLKTLNIAVNSENITKITEQILFPNYKLVNRIVNADEQNSEAVPFEYADRIIKSNISSFKAEYVLTSARQIPVHKFQMNHTRKGSFIIPISIPAEYDENTLIDFPSLTNRVLKSYLAKMDFLTKIDLTDAKTFATKIIENGIDSKMVKDFMSKDGLVKYTQQYNEIIKSVDIYGESSPIVDFKLKTSDKSFADVDLDRLQEVSDEHLEYLKNIEIQMDQEAIDENDISIEAIVDSLSYRDKNRTEGAMKFTVYKVGGEKLKKPFKALAVGLTKKRLKKFGEIFYTAEIVRLKGDISKSKGKIGDLRIEEVLDLDRQGNLFKDLDS